MSYKQLREKFEEFKRKKGIETMSREALKWFLIYSRKFVKTATFRKTADLGSLTYKPLPGKFYLYRYDPKTKEDMPYYDIMPLVLITEITEDGWYGINFHYMPPSVRLRIMEGFFGTLNDSKLSDNMRLKINWKRAVTISQAVSAHKYLRHSIKRYLVKQIRSPLIELEPQYWPMVIFLPLSRFKKEKASKVWKDV
jgi:hypothetical protein